MTKYKKYDTMTKEDELKKVNIELLKIKQGFIPRFGSKEDLTIIQWGNKMKDLKSKNKLKIEEEINIKKNIIYFLKKRNENAG